MKLEIRNLKKSFGQQVVLDNISLVLEKVHTLALIGPSGGGKSTLLRVIAGLERPDQGEVWLNDAEIIFEEKLLREHRRTVGTVFQSFNLFPHLTAFANVTLPLEKVHGHPPKQAREMAEEILERFQLMEHAHKQPAQLSGGQRQRIAIARAVA
ncbi:MAG TPA: ATP-binding cassette domain-containing protein, partial [Chthoniobacterales bacterium]|nr:ATP-binding cassette domain-containing protein [Chthoniobacterales bacterium]